MKQYLDLCKHVFENGTKKATEQGQVQSVPLAIKCDLIYKKAFLSLQQKN